MDFSRCLLFMLQSSYLLSPLCGILERKLAKSVGNKSQCQPPERKSQSQGSVAKDRYSMDYTPGKLLTLTKSTRQQHHESKGGNPCTAILGSLGTMIQ